MTITLEAMKQALNMVMCEMNYQNQNYDDTCRARAVRVERRVMRGD